MNNITPVSINFVRTSRNNLDALAIFRCYAKDPEDVLGALEVAVTKWSRETKDGKACWKSSDGAINIGDLAAFANTDEGLPRTLIPYLREQGLMTPALESVSLGTCEVSFDHHLVREDLG